MVLYRTALGGFYEVFLLPHISRVFAKMLVEHIVARLYALPTLIAIVREDFWSKTLSRLEKHTVCILKCYAKPAEHNYWLYHLPAKLDHAAEEC